MKNLSVDFSSTQGKIKPMHAVNNGPVYKPSADQRVTNMDDYKAAGIPYARNHDASFFSTYGGNHTVDVNFIFTDFDADPYDENSYDFACTDQYMMITAMSGAKTFYRLGSRIEHEVKKYNTLPPKDYKKWAIICEHIIKHYNYGWANGFHYNIEYWEIWNEPDLDEDDSTNKRNWGGTKKEFFEFFNIAAKYLKETFPELKIGGPAIAWRLDWAEDFLKQLKVPLDFFSWHCYGYETFHIKDMVLKVRELLDKYGFEKTENILNEWNYVNGWETDKFLYSLETISGLKGAAFTSAAMLSCQNLPLDMLMYYDARPCGFNGLWAPYTYKKLKGYYPFFAFNVLYQLGENVAVESDKDLYIAAAKNETEKAIVITHYTNEDNDEGQEFTLNLSDVELGAQMEVYILDKEHNLDLTETKEYRKNEILRLNHNATMLIKLK